MEKRQNEICVVEGFGDKGILELVQAIQALNGRLITVIHGCPPESAHETPEARIQAVQTEIRKRQGMVDVIGHSYGALLALAAALREEFRNIKHLVLVDGPLRQDVPVPPPANGKFDIFKSHYEKRVEVARECERLLDVHEPYGRILTMGTQQDSIVPPGAKQLRDPNYHHIWLPEKFIGHDLKDNIQGVIPHVLRFLQ